MAQLPRPGDSHGNLLWKITENTFEGGGGGAVAVGTAIGGSTPDRVLQTGPLGQLESGAVTTTELGFLAGATSNIQVQINALSGGIVGIESAADATAMWLTAEENIGIGTSTPAALLEIKAQSAFTGTGTISSSGLIVTGVGTAFLTELHVGDTITAQSQTVTILNIVSDTSMNVSAAFVPNLSASTAFTYQQATQRWVDSGGASAGFVDSRGRLFVGALSGSQVNGILSVSQVYTGAFDLPRTLATRSDVNITSAPFGGFINSQLNLVSVSATHSQNMTNVDSLIALQNQILVINGATGTIESAMALRLSLSNSAPGCTITNSYILKEGSTSATGVYTNFAGISLQNRTVATNNTNLLIGTNNVIPSGNWSIYNSSGYVNYFEGSFGIGTSAPDGKLHIFTASAGTITPETFADDFIIENSVFPGMSFLSPNDTVATIAFADPQDSDVGSINYNHTLDILSIKAGGVETFYVSASKVGIGIPLPDGTLHVMTATAGAIVTNLFADELTLENNDHCGMTILTPNDKVAVIYFGDTDDNDVGQISYNHSLDTLTLTAGTVNVVNIISAACNPAADNTIRLGSSGVRWTEVFATNGVINTSDAREKHDIEDIDAALASRLVDKFTPRSYVWNTEAAFGTHYGFVAQEIEAVLRQTAISPQHFGPLHYDRENDRYGLRQAELLPFLWRVVQDLQRRVAAIET